MSMWIQHQAVGVRHERNHHGEWNAPTTTAAELRWTVSGDDISDAEIEAMIAVAKASMLAERDARRLADERTRRLQKDLLDKKS